MELTGKTSTGDMVLEVVRGDQSQNDQSTQPDMWEYQAAGVVLERLLQIIRSGNIPAEVHVDSARLEQMRNLTISDKLDQLMDPSDPRYPQLEVAARWWDENRASLKFVARDQLPFPYVISLAEQTEADVFAVVFNQLQARGLDNALRSLGLDLQLIARSPKLLQDTVWFQPQLMIHDKLKSSGIITPQDLPIFKQS